MRKTRPLGITIIVLIEILFSLILFMIGVGLVFVNEFANYIPDVSDSLAVKSFLPFIGIIIVMVSIFSLVVSWGLWAGRKTAWVLTLASTVLGAVGGLVNLPTGIGNFIVGIFIVWYLLEPHVKAFYFTKQSDESNTLTYTSKISHPSKTYVVYCTRCGAENRVEDNFCRKCGNRMKKLNS